MTGEKALPRARSFAATHLGCGGWAVWPGTKETSETKHAASDQGQSLCAVWAGICPSRGHHDLHQGRRRSYRRERWSALILCRLVRRKRHPARNATFLPGSDRQPQASRNIKRGTPFSCVNRSHTCNASARLSRLSLCLAPSLWPKPHRTRAALPQTRVVSQIQARPRTAHPWQHRRARTRATHKTSAIVAILKT